MLEPCTATLRPRAVIDLIRVRYLVRAVTIGVDLVKVVVHVNILVYMLVACPTLSDICCLGCDHDYIICAM